MVILKSKDHFRALSVAIFLENTFVEFDVDDISSITRANDSSFNCFNELIKDVKYNRVARFHPTNNDGDCILKNTNTTSSNKRQDAQYAVISGN